ncbi:MAG: hypothetical protein V4608_12165 [Bacteroidota bacterium]
MQDAKVWDLITKNLTGNEDQTEKEAFLIWFNQSKKNENYFYKVKSAWDDSVSDSSEVHLTLLENFSWPKIKIFIRKQAVGNLVGFIVGMWVVTTFSHEVLERKSIKNLFGLAGRKKVVVDEIPHWLQSTLSILIGFIVLELINHFFRTKKYLLLWTLIKKKFNSST